MRKKLRLLPLLLLFLLLPGLVGCGGDDSQPYRVIEKLGTVQYGTVFRAGDRAAEPVIAAVRVLAAGGKLSELSNGWLGSDIISLDGDAAALDDIRPTLEARTLIVGVEESFCPIAYESDGEYIGLAVDMAKAIGELLGWEIRIQPISGTQLSAQLASGNIDCALGFGVEGLSADAFTVGDCFMQSEVVLAVPRDSKIRSVRGLKGLKIGSVKSYAAIEVVAKDEKCARYAQSVTAYLSPVRCLNALELGWCAAVCMDSIMLRSYYTVG